MERVAISVNGIIGRVCPMLPLNIALKTAWAEIIGSNLREFVSFSGVRLGVDGELCVLVKVVSSASIVFRFSSEEIIDKISKLSGRTTSQIKLVVKQVLKSDMGYRDAA